MIPAKSFTERHQSTTLIRLALSTLTQSFRAEISGGRVHSNLLRRLHSQRGEIRKAREIRCDSQHVQHRKATGTNDKDFFGRTL